MNNNKTATHEAPINNYTKLPNSLLKVKENTIKPVENQDKSSPLINFNHIRSKRIYKKFLKLIKGKRALNGVILADILGITRQTVYKWLDTPSAVEVLENNISELTNKIHSSKDWKASAYLLDKLYNKEDVTNIQVNTLDGLTIIRR